MNILPKSPNETLLVPFQFDAVNESNYTKSIAVISDINLYTVYHVKAQVS